VLNFTDGTSGCQLNCIACGYICPTSAIRHVSISEKLGIDEFAERGPIRIGSAYVDRTRCLPWAMNTPCIVCQENCPVTPKAIYVTEVYETVRSGIRDIVSAEGNEIRVSGPAMEPGRYATGDYYLVCRASGKDVRYRISSNSEGMIITSSTSVLTLKRDDQVRIQVCLHQPNIDLKRCIGCGICTHECPVGGRRAIRITSDNESRGVKKVA
jgi:formate hydrogenlyase subunit 6/NADH:ubiquinone oxidoreductase subunit I